MSDEIAAVETTGTEGAAAATPETFDQTLDRVATEVINREPVRGSNGQFQAKVVAPGAPAANDVPGGPQTAQTPDPAPPVIEAPQSLPADVKGEWAKLPPTVQKYWADRESEVHKKFTTDGERLKSLGAFEEVLVPYAERLKQIGAPAPEVIRRLLEADRKLTTSPREAILEVAQMYGINLGALQSPGAQPDPNSALAQQVTQLQSQLKALTESQEHAKIAAAEEQIKAARKDMPHFDAVEPLMAKLYEPGMDLKQLYQRAIRAHDETWAKVQAEEKAAADKKAAEEAKAKADKDRALAPLGKRPGSAPTAPLKGKTWEDTLDRVSAEVRARQ